MTTFAFELDSLVHQTSTCVDGCLARWKIGFAALLFLEAIVFAHLIYLLKRVTVRSAEKFSRAFHLGNALSAGVFLAAGLLHILPEAISLFEGTHDESAEEEAEEEHEGENDDEEEHGEHSSQFPWAYLVVLLSFYSFFFIEKILLPFLLPKHAAHHIDVEAVDVASKEISGGDESEENNEKEAFAAAATKGAGFGSREFAMGLCEILGISAHSLFESMALGLSSSFSTVLNILIATVAHRWATSAAIGFKLLRSLNYLPFLVLLLVFSSVAPLGVGIGAALGGLSQTSQGVLFAVSGGTFVYVGGYEAMADEYDRHRKWPIQKFMMTLAGASIIIVVTVILNVLDIHG